MIENKHLARFSQFSKLQSCNNRTTNNDLYTRTVLHKQRMFLFVFSNTCYGHSAVVTETKRKTDANYRKADVKKLHCSTHASCAARNCWSLITQTASSLKLPLAKTNVYASHLFQHIGGVMLCSHAY